MEYMTIYGTAIVIIVIAITILYSLGVFNLSGSYLPKVQPGACKISNPLASSEGVAGRSLEGTCQGVLPATVAYFNGQSANVVTPLYMNVTPSGWTGSTWVYVTGDSTGWCGTHSNVMLNDRGTGAGESLTMGTSPSSGSKFGFFFGYDTNGVGKFATTSQAYTYNSWYNVVGVYNSSYGFQVFVNGQNEGYYTNSGTHSGSTCSAGALTNTEYTSTFPWVIGYEKAWTSYFNGWISNVQIYNTSFSTNQVSTLYQEGIGGAPTELLYLVAWWPLNENGNDYSSNNYNTTPSGIDYLTNWSTTYPG
jgi:hypothetical protein